MNNIWITFADNEIYLKSAYALALSLKQVNSKYPLCIMYPCTLDIKQYQNSFYDVNIIFKEVPYLYFNFLEQYKQNVTINKFHMFSLIEYDKICFLDADTVIAKNIDNIFSYKTPLIGYYINNKQEKCFSGGVLLFKPDLQFYSLLLNLCITLDFYDDDNLFYYLYYNNLINFQTFINDVMSDYHNYILQEQKQKKFFTDYSFQEIYILMKDNGISLLKQYIEI